MKYRVIYRFKDKYPITLMCSFFDVSRSGYYSWLRKKDQENKDMVLVEKITICQEKSKKTYGYRRVRIWLLRKHGLLVNHKALLRIMNQYNLLSEVRRRRKYKKYSQEVHRYGNLLNRDFQASQPNQKWVTDISYIHTGQGVLYLSMVKDLYDGFIVHFETGTEQTVNLVTKTVQMAVKKRRGRSWTCTPQRPRVSIYFHGIF
ncbi:IS3 family transposase [Heliophilum fasciatum]|uniref:Integrase-like protein n=1 Tax=Heliophilum fasciatum TaxID=35700 RepID=A0A4R2RJN3_9FIRM|nr:IS3 family transposase [Heliophilum fasciatum]MCW2278987.1 transposase InsO family protein [Heliophilum fasciatum]TCP64062.1 integrase-like protein [Heliophilum fasciatum]